MNLATSRYDNIVVMWDINIDTDDPNVSGYQELRECMIPFDPMNLIRTKRCITRGHESSLDRILSNKPYSHIHSKTFELGVSDFHKISITILRSQVARLKPRKIS